jgi:hypothetical protein
MTCDAVGHQGRGGRAERAYRRNRRHRASSPKSERPEFHHRGAQDDPIGLRIGGRNRGNGDRERGDVRIGTLRRLGNKKGDTERLWKSRHWKSAGAMRVSG